MQNEELKRTMETNKMFYMGYLAAQLEHIKRQLDEMIEEGKRYEKQSKSERGVK